MSQINYIRKFNEVGMKDISLVGGKNASLGEMYQALRPLGVHIPEGFVITADVFSKLFENEDLSDKVYSKLSKLNGENVAELAQAGHEIRNLLRQKGLPVDIKTDIRNAYISLCKLVGKDNVDVAVRSSATAEDLPDASFAGQQETFLNVRGEEALLEATINCIASLFTDRAISYRMEHGFDHRKVRLSIGVQQMVRSDLASSGVIFTLDTETGARNVVLVTSAYGLGENIVGGRVDPDEFLVLKPLVESEKVPIIRRKCGKKQLRMTYSFQGEERTKNLEVSAEEQEKFSLSENEVIKLSRWALLIEDYYSKLHNRETPMDIEWAKDGENGELFIVQARPETVYSRKSTRESEVMALGKKSRILLKGKAVGTKIGAGKARVISNVSELNQFKQGEILIADMTDPDWEPVMKKASAIVTNRGGRTCHAAIVSRELGVPCVVGTGLATKSLQTGQEITVSCAEGEEGLVFEGILPFTTRKLDWKKTPQLKTKIMVNIGNPDQALKVSILPVDGVGLARLEFIITEYVKVHPMALVHPERIKDKTIQKEIKKIIRGFEINPGDYFIQRLSEGISMIAGAFWPRPVIVRLSDFKTNEYANLLGGIDFEPEEENPMIGYRGASRYYSEGYRDGFALECKALKHVRDEMGLTNVKVMVPFCRSAKEGIQVIQEMAKHGLTQGENGLEVYVMCEIPSNVMDLFAFARVFDGFSIGSNDLTQMTLGVDRDSELLAHLFDERDPAVLAMLTLAIERAKKAGRPIGICGQAPSDYIEIVNMLVEKDIDSISLSPDSVIPTIDKIYAAEKKRENDKWYF